MWIIMSKDTTLTITNLQKKIILEHLKNIQLGLNSITEETSFLIANFKAINIILEDIK